MGVTARSAWHMCREVRHLGQLRKATPHHSNVVLLYVAVQDGCPCSPMRNANQVVTLGCVCIEAQRPAQAVLQLFWCFPDLETHFARLCGVLVTLHRREVRWP